MNTQPVSIAAMTASGRVHLRRPATEEQLEIIVTWLSEGSPAAALTSDIRENLTLEKLRDAIAGGFQVRLIQRHDGEPVGIVTWRQHGHRRAFDFAILIGDPDLWRSGVGGEAAMLCVDYLFMVEDAERVGLTTGSHNPYTSPALARAGFTLEGWLRHFYYVDGEYHDGIVWSILRDEHRELVAQASEGPLAYRPLIDRDTRRRGQAGTARLLRDPQVPRSWDPENFMETN